MNESGGDASSSSSSSVAGPVVDNSGTVISKIANLYAERLMSDVVLVVGTAEFPSHRLILCASSDVFQIMLMNPNWTESQETRVQLRETPSCEAVFEDFLKYLYTGKIQLDYATVIPLVSLADKYDVKDLLRIGLDYMTRNVSTACKRNQVVSWFQFTTAAGHAAVADLCAEFIKGNFMSISHNVDFPNMELENLVHFIQSSDLVVEDEMALFLCVDKWLKSKEDIMVVSGENDIDLHLDRCIGALIPHIRFPMMTPSQLANLLLNPLSKSHTELLVEKIRVAMSYHKNQLLTMDEEELWGQFDPRLFTPRLYTTERFCATLSIDHLHHLQSYHCRSLLFSSQRHTAEFEGEEQSEWFVNFYPKGVWFQRCLTVYTIGGPPSGLEVPERVLRTVRISVSTRDSSEQRVRIGILLVGSQDGFEHVRKVMTRNFFFSGDDQIVNFDDIIDFDELNDAKQKSNFLSGSDKDSLKVHVVVTPLNNYSSLEVA